MACPIRRISAFSHPVACPVRQLSTFSCPVACPVRHPVRLLPYASPSLALLPVPSAFSRPIGANGCGRASGEGRVRERHTGASRGASGRPERVGRRGQQVQAQACEGASGCRARVAHSGLHVRACPGARRGSLAGGSMCGRGAGGQLSLSLFPHPSPEKYRVNKQLRVIVFSVTLSSFSVSCTPKCLMNCLCSGEVALV
ncbi:uncharacterized protein LOC109726978 [Ananas comosus]|uniref:Uncharacterized protein LOC109726978 n=1 Tax=Ananas comosus TaxID=4615 RepID=A0A6P5GUR8_ANACO|nr:uncharacterized protein LOC109726978 [Ananas comosus]